MSKTYKKIDISKLLLDVGNPRLPKSKQNAQDERDIIDWMLLEASTLELMMAIGQNGYFDGEQLLVVKDNGNYIVVEGNRRLTAVKLLSSPELARAKKIAIKEIVETTTEKPTRIPCLIFDDKNEILKYLGFRHITGIKSWKLLEKARYLTSLKDSQFRNISFKTSCNNIAKMIGSSSSYVKRLLIGYELYSNIEEEGFYNISGLNDTKFHLNYFVDSLLKENIRDFIKIDIQSDTPTKDIDNENLKKITTWWFDKAEGVSRVIGDSKGLNALNTVLGEENALEAFEKGMYIFDALELTNDVDINFQKEVQKALRILEHADSLSNKVHGFYDGLYDDLKSIRKVALKIKEFQEQLEKEGDDF